MAPQRFTGGGLCGGLVGWRRPAGGQTGPRPLTMAKQRTRSGPSGPLGAALDVRLVDATWSAAGTVGVLTGAASAVPTMLVNSTADNTSVAPTLPSFRTPSPRFGRALRLPISSPGSCGCRAATV